MYLDYPLIERSRTTLNITRCKFAGREEYPPPTFPDISRTRVLNMKSVVLSY